MTPEQQLRDEWKAMDFDAPAGLRTKAAVGRLLDPIPEGEYPDVWLAAIAYDEKVKYRAWLIGGEQ